MRSFIKIRVWIACVLYSMACYTLFAENKSSEVFVEDGTYLPDFPKVKFINLNNHDNKTIIKFEIYPGKEPLNIYNIKWNNNGHDLIPLEPFELSASNKDQKGNDIIWMASVEFPYTNIFEISDKLVLSTDKGFIKATTNQAGYVLEQLENLEQNYDQLSKTTYKTKTGFVVLIIVLVIVIVFSGVLLLVYVKKSKSSNEEIRKLFSQIENSEDKNNRIEFLMEDLFRNKYSTLNFICDEYYEKNESDNVKLSMFNEIEKHILDFKDKDNIRNLENDVNLFLDNIITRIKTQLPELNKNDITFLTLLYSGLSPRTICLFSGIKLKTYYYRKNKLKELILASNAVDKEFFVSKM